MLVNVKSYWNQPVSNAISPGTEEGFKRSVHRNNQLIKKSLIYVKS